jgi:hypothetical protein
MDDWRYGCGPRAAASRRQDTSRLGRRGARRSRQGNHHPGGRVSRLS